LDKNGLSRPNLGLLLLNNLGLLLITDALEGVFKAAELAELAAAADETLFENILHNKQRVLHQLLPDRTQPTCNLRSRKHDCSLTIKQSVTAIEFITRMLY